MFNCEFHRSACCIPTRSNSPTASWVHCLPCVLSTGLVESSIQTGTSPLEPFRSFSNINPPKGGPILLITVGPGRLVEGHPDLLKINRLLKLLRLLPSLLVQLGELSNNDPARKRPRSLLHLPMSPKPDPLFLRGPSGNVSVCDLSRLPFFSTLLSVADTRYVPTPPTTEPQLLVPPRVSPGLFGPRSPRDSLQP